MLESKDAETQTERKGRSVAHEQVKGPLFQNDACFTKFRASDALRTTRGIVSAWSDKPVICSAVRCAVALLTASSHREPSA
jgi:hypothetical protein